MTDTPKLRRTHELTPAAHPTWLGVGWIPRSEITVLVGDEGIGKSLLWVQIAAAVTTGQPFPPFRIPRRDPADVLVIVTEDAAAEVQERLRLAGADLARVVWFSMDADGTGAPSFSKGGGPAMSTLVENVRALDAPPALVVLDAWLDTVDSGLQVKDGQQARIALNPWKRFADTFRTSVMLLTHTNRLPTANTRDLMGSSAVLRQKARMVLFAARPDDGHAHLYVGPDKANTTGLRDAVRFTVQAVQARPATDDDPGTTARLVEATDTGQTIRELVGEWRSEAQESSRKPSKAEQAADDIRRLFLSKGAESMAVADVNAHLGSLGYGKNAIAEGKSMAGESRSTGLRGAWVLTLNQTSQPHPASLGSMKVGNIGEIEDVNG